MVSQSFDNSGSGTEIICKDSEVCIFEKTYQTAWDILTGDFLFKDRGYGARKVKRVQ